MNETELNAARAVAAAIGAADERLRGEASRLVSLPGCALAEEWLRKGLICLRYALETLPKRPEAPS